MFDRNDPAMPVQPAFRPDGSMYSMAEYGLTKFEQCAKDFTAAALPYFLSLYYDNLEREDHRAMILAAQAGILAAEEFCRQMEGREK